MCIDFSCKHSSWLFLLLWVSLCLIPRKEATTKFLRDNNFLSIVRGHEAQLNGYKMSKWNGEGQFPPVITVFSAPNYCDVYKNKGAVIKFSVCNL